MTEFYLSVDRPSKMVSSVTKNIHPSFIHSAHLLSGAGAILDSEDERRISWKLHIIGIQTVETYIHLNKQVIVTAFIKWYILQSTFGRNNKYQFSLRETGKAHWKK